MSEIYQHYEKIREITGKKAKTCLIVVGDDHSLVLRSNSEDSGDVREALKVLIHRYIDDVYSENGFEPAKALLSFQELSSTVIKEWYEENIGDD